MEKLLIFNGLKILLTTGQCLSEVQSYLDHDPDIILSIYRGDVRIIKGFDAE